MRHRLGLATRTQVSVHSSLTLVFTQLISKAHLEHAIDFHAARLAQYRNLLFDIFIKCLNIHMDKRIDECFIHFFIVRQRVIFV